MGLIQQFQKAGAQRRKEVAALCREVATMRADADAFVGHLHQVSADRRKEVATLVAEADAFVRHLQQLSGNRRKEVVGMRSDTDAFVGHLHQLTAARRKEVAAIHAKVWGGAAPAAGATAPAAARKPARAGATRAPAKGTPTTLREVIFTYLAEHPDGAKLTQMERDMRIARIRLAKEMKRLIEANKVQKREMLYFAV